MSEQTYHGSCHCGAVRFEARLDLDQPLSRCNCSFDTKGAIASQIIAPEAFTLIAGADVLTDYHREGNPNHYPFCSRCGMHAFGYLDIPQIGGKKVTVNVNCLDGVEIAGRRAIHWDGRHDNWQAGPRPQPWPIL